jgi:hypothetical protein
MPAGARGIDAVWYNPAGLAMIERRELSGSYQAMVEEISQGTLGYAQRLGERSGIAAFVSYLDYGNQDRTTLSTAGAFVTVNRAGAFEAQDLVGGIAAGRRVTEMLDVGASVKFVRSQLDNATASAFAADLGFEARLSPELPVVIGATVRNLGSDLTFDRVEEDLPLTFQFGARALLFHDRIGLYAAGERVPHEQIEVRGGIEVLPFGSTLALRAGYDGANEVDNGLTAGLGITIRNLTLDYAYIPFEKFGDNHRVALTVRF